MTVEQWEAMRAGAVADPSREERLRRKAAKLGIFPPLPQCTTTTVQRSNPVAGSPRPCCQRGKPGNELTALLKSLGIDSKWCATGCSGYSAQMNAWGVTGCRERRAEIVQRLEQQRNGVDWITQASVAAKMLTTGVYLMVNPLDPLGSLVDIAIMRAEKCESGSCEA